MNEGKERVCGRWRLTWWRCGWLGARWKERSNGWATRGRIQAGMVHWAQLPHSYHFTTRILVLKFVNKRVFFKEIQDSHFPRKKGYFGTHLIEFGEKGVNFDVQCFTVKKGVHLGWKVSVLPEKRGSFWTEKCVLSWKSVLLSWKVSVLQQKGDLFKLENKDGYHFFQWVREPGCCAGGGSMQVEGGCETPLSIPSWINALKHKRLHHTTALTLTYYY